MAGGRRHRVAPFDLPRAGLVTKRTNRSVGTAAPLRELFIEDLAEVAGGGPLEKVRRVVEEYLVTTYRCGEEIMSVC